MLRLHNTLSREIVGLEPLEAGRVRMYSCGPTVYRPIHIGNLRTFLLSDLLRRVLAYHGLEVYSAMNITDVGHMTDEVSETGRDRMLLAVEDEGLGAADIAAKYTQAFFSDIHAVNVRDADVYAKATEHIPQIVEMIAKLLERGHAYTVNGDIFYDVTSFEGYGRLSHQSLDDMQAGHRLEEVDSRKRNHQDFSLWVSAGQRRELVFDSPWGTGYPGWHIECSAMSLHYLGERFDIHVGGVDLRFPHHEDEIAQSEGTVGHEVVRTWVHGEHLLLDRAKMAKSAGNVVTIRTIADAGHDPLAFRYLCFTARYRRQFHFDEDALHGAGTALRRLRETVAGLGASGDIALTDAALLSAVDDPAALAYHDRFLAAVDDDLDFPAALTVLHEAITDASVAPQLRWTLVASWDEILGLDLVGRGEVPDHVAELIAERGAARAAKDFARADEIRDRLRGEGIDLLDSADGTRWVRRS